MRATRAEVRGTRPRQQLENRRFTPRGREIDPAAQHPAQRLRQHPRGEFARDGHERSSLRVRRTDHEGCAGQAVEHVAHRALDERSLLLDDEHGFEPGGERAHLVAFERVDRAQAEHPDAGPS